MGGSDERECVHKCTRMCVHTCMCIYTWRAQFGGMELWPSLTSSCPLHPDIPPRVLWESEQRSQDIPWLHGVRREKRASSRPEANGQKFSSR